MFWTMPSCLMAWTMRLLSAALDQMPNSAEVLPITCSALNPVMRTKVGLTMA